jgi:hypothetical protein
MGRFYQKGQVMGKNLQISLDHIDVHNDHDGWGRGAGDIYFKYSLDGGLDEVIGTTGVDHHINSGKDADLNYDFDVYAENQLYFSVSVWDSDWPDGDDRLGPDNLLRYFTADENFGIGSHEHSTDDYTLFYSIVEI